MVMQQISLDFGYIYETSANCHYSGDRYGNRYGIVQLYQNPQSIFR
jgi:hypothetical protein